MLVAWILEKRKFDGVGFIRICICIYTRIYVYVLYTYTYMCVYIHTDISTVFSHFDTRFTLDEGLVGVNSQGRNWPGSS